MCAGEWKRHTSTELFRDFKEEDWEQTLCGTRNWIDSNKKNRSKRVVTGKRKRKRTPAVTVAPPAEDVSASAAIPPPSDLPAPASDSNDILPELGDMLRDCQQMQRALTRVMKNIQKYISATTDDE